NTELEEAFATTTSLPEHLQLKAGTFFTAFGRQNPTHPHTWEFVTQPIVLNRFFGPDGARNPGAQLSWLAPTSFFLELTYSIQQSTGENAQSFLGQEGSTLAGYSFTERKVGSLLDFQHLLHARTSHELSETTTGVLGVSALIGDNATGTHNLTQIYG